METTTYASYQEAAREYLAHFQAMRDIPPPAVLAPRGARRGAAMMDRAEGDLDRMVDQAVEIAGVSAAMVPMARDLLDAPEVETREAMSGQLLAQAAAELQLATELLGVAAGAQTLATGPVTRAARGSALAFAIDDLERAMTTPLEAGLEVAADARRGAAPAPADAATARQLLHDTAIESAKRIVSSVQEFGGDVAWSLIFQTEWAAVVDGAALVRKDVASKLEALKEGAGALLEKAIAAASSTLLNVWDKILALLGKDVEDKARTMVRKWLTQIKEEGKIALFSTLVDTLYRVEAFDKELAEWLAAREVSAEQFSTATAAVRAVGDAFGVLVDRMSTLEDVIGLAKIVKIPQVLAIVAGLQVALLATLVFLGYDYVGYKPFAFVNITRGVGEVIHDTLGA